MAYWHFKPRYLAWKIPSWSACKLQLQNFAMVMSRLIYEGISFAWNFARYFFDWQRLLIHRQILPWLLFSFVLHLIFISYTINFLPHPQGGNLSNQTIITELKPTAFKLQPSQPKEQIAQKEPRSALSTELDISGDRQLLAYYPSSALSELPIPNEPVRMENFVDLGAGITGTLIINLWINAEGVVERIQNTGDSLAPNIISAINDTFLHLQFRPGLIDGVAVGSLLQIAITIDYSGQPSLNTENHPYVVDSSFQHLQLSPQNAKNSPSAKPN